MEVADRFLAVCLYVKEIAQGKIKNQNKRKKYIDKFSNYW